jgi:hypothetical protein
VGEIFPVASALFSRGVPFVFTTGYARWNIPEELADATLCEKPIDTGLLSGFIPVIG